MIAGCHHQSVKQVVALLMHAQKYWIRFYNNTHSVCRDRDSRTVFQFYEYICSNRYRCHTFNVPQGTHPINANL